jgi:DNA-binding transcriptional LysR family regulator
LPLTLFVACAALSGGAAPSGSNPGVIVRYLRKYGVPQGLHELDAHRCSAFRPDSFGRVVAWRVKVGDDLREQHVRPTFCTNDEMLELNAVLAGEIIAQVAVPTAAALIRSGQLVPLLLEHRTEVHHLYLYYGSRSAQPARVRRFIDLAVERLTNSVQFVLSNEELLRAHAEGVRGLVSTVSA